WYDNMSYQPRGSIGQGKGGHHHGRRDSGAVGPPGPRAAIRQPQSGHRGGGGGAPGSTRPPPPGGRVRPARSGRRAGHGGRGSRHGWVGVADILRGEIRWAELDPTRGSEQAGQRPVLIISHDVFNQRSGTVIALALTSQPQRAGFPLTLELTSTRLPKRSWVKISQVRTLSTERIGKRLGK